MKKALIISGGEFENVSIDDSFDYIIACDKGARYSKDLKKVPDLIIGDFDSYEGSIYNDFPNVEILSFPVEKDDTDTMLAIKTLLSKGYKDITVICALGGNMDHTIANIQSLSYIANEGGTGRIISSKETLSVYGEETNTITISKNSSNRFSVFSLSDCCTDVSISGSHYDVTNILLKNTFPLGLGNHFVNSTVTITKKSGQILVIS